MVKSKKTVEDMVMAHLKVIAQHFSEGTEKNQENLSQKGSP
jgi:hypothetical protein